MYSTFSSPKKNSSSDLVTHAWVTFLRFGKFCHIAIRDQRWRLFSFFEILGVVSKIEIAKRAMLLYLLFVGRHENDEVESGKYWLFKHACH